MTGGTTPYYAYWPTPGNGTVEVNGNALTFYYMHKDWLGNARISSTVVNHTVISDQAYAPYGEVYNKLATGAGVPAQMFTGDTQDILTGLFDTPNRELNASQGRWLSPDPAGAGWNQYAYATNPNSAVDPSGLKNVPASWYLGFSAFNSSMASMDAFGQSFDNWINATFGTVPADNPPPGSPNTNSSASDLPVSSSNWLAAWQALAPGALPPDDAANGWAVPVGPNLLAAANQYQAPLRYFNQVADMIGTFSLLLGIDGEIGSPPPGAGEGPES